MELRQYLAVVRRRWPLVASIVALTAVLSLGLLLIQRPVYTAAAVLALRQSNLPTQPPAPNQPGFYTFDNYYNWYSSEFLADDYTLIVPSTAFAARVNDKLKGQNKNIAADGALAASRMHRELTIAASAADPLQAAAIVRAAADVLTDLSVPTGTTPNLNGVSIHDNALFAVISEAPVDGAGVASNRSRLQTNALIALAVGLALALALAFLVEYLDNHLRDTADAERVTGLPVIGAIPVHD